MASLIKKMKKGRPYYYAVESARVNGKPRIVWQKYLGTVDAIVKRLAQTRPEKPHEAVLFEAGGVAALLVTRDFQIPMFHKVYEGNVPDVSLFPNLAQEL